MGAAEAVLLAGGFHRLQRGGGGGGVHGAGVGQRTGDLGVGGGAVQQHAVLRRESGQAVVDVPVGPQRHAVSGQRIGDGGGDGLGLDEQHRVHLAQQQERQKYRRAGHVAAPQVQRPGDVGQVGEQQVAGVFLRHFLPQQRQLLPAGYVALQRPQGLGGQGGPVGPHLLRQVVRAVPPDGQIPVFQPDNAIRIQQLPQGRQYAPDPLMVSVYPVYGRTA